MNIKAITLAIVFGIGTHPVPPAPPHSADFEACPGRLGCAMQTLSKCWAYGGTQTYAYDMQRSVDGTEVIECVSYCRDATFTDRCRAWTPIDDPGPCDEWYVGPRDCETDPCAEDYPCGGV